MDNLAEFGSLQEMGASAPGPWRTGATLPDGSTFTDSTAWTTADVIPTGFLKPVIKQNAQEQGFFDKFKNASTANKVLIIGALVGVIGLGFYAFRKK